MKRITLSIIVLAVTGGCITVEPDPINEYPYPTSQRVPGQSASRASKGLWYGANGQPLSMAYADGVSRSNGPSTNATKSWANPPQSTTVASKTSSVSSTSTTTAVKPSSARPAAKTDKNDDAVVKASFTETTSIGDKTMSVKAPVKPVAAKTAAKTPAAQAEAASPPVNLGLLRLINNKRITIRYEVKDPAALGVADLEIWGTTDMRTWKKYDVARRSSSSLVVDVKDEGLYGFTVLARAKNELTRNQPPSGEPPQMWVAVDLTKPVVQLLGVDMKAMEHSSSVIVRWNAKDRNLGPRPITLLYAERPEGPWSPLAANLENSGRYEWTLPAHAPADLCVRVQATDLMGNVGLAQTAKMHIPERAAKSDRHTVPELGTPTCLASSSPLNSTNHRPSAARPPHPTVSIVSVDGQ